MLNLVNKSKDSLYMLRGMLDSLITEHISVFLRDYLIDCYNKDNPKLELQECLIDICNPKDTDNETISDKEFYNDTKAALRLELLIPKYLEKLSMFFKEFIYELNVNTISKWSDYIKKKAKIDFGKSGRNIESLSNELSNARDFNTPVEIKDMLNTPIGKENKFQTALMLLISITFSGYFSKSNLIPKIQPESMEKLSSLIDPLPETKLKEKILNDLLFDIILPLITSPIEQVKDIFKDEVIFEYFFISAYILKIDFYEVLEDKKSILLAEEVRKNLGDIEDSCPMNDPKFEGILKKYKSNIPKDFTCILKKQNLLKDSVYLKNDLILTSYIRVLTALYLKSSDFNQKMYYATTLLSIMMKTEKGGTVLIDTFVETKWDSEADIDLNSCPFEEASSNSTGPKEYGETKSRSVIFLSSLFKFVIKYNKSNNYRTFIIDE